MACQGMPALNTRKKKCSRYSVPVQPTFQVIFVVCTYNSTLLFSYSGFSDRYALKTAWLHTTGLSRRFGPTSFCFVIWMDTAWPGLAENAAGIRSKVKGCIWGVIPPTTIITIWLACVSFLKKSALTTFLSRMLDHTDSHTLFPIKKYCACSDNAEFVFVGLM